MGRYSQSNLATLTPKLRVDSTVTIQHMYVHTYVANFTCIVLLKVVLVTKTCDVAIQYLSSIVATLYTLATHLHTLI